MAQIDAEHGSIGIDRDRRGVSDSIARRMRRHGGTAEIRSEPGRGTEVELILVNGVSVGFSHPVRDGDRISVYPKFEALDVSPLLRIRERPLRTPSRAASAGASSGTE